MECQISELGNAIGLNISMYESVLLLVIESYGKWIGLFLGFYMVCVDLNMGSRVELLIL